MKSICTVFLCFLISVSACISITCHAQTVKFTSDEFPGIQKQMNSSGNYHLPLNEREFLYAGGKKNSDDVTLLKLNKDCKTIWSGPKIEGFLSAAVFGNNILVFSTKNSNRFGFRIISSVHVTLINNANGTIITEKDISTFSDKAITDIQTLTDSNGRFKYLLLRTTAQEKMMMGEFKANQQFGNSKDIQAVSFDSDVNIQKKVLDINKIQTAQFISCTCNNSGDIFIASIQNNIISVCRYNADASQVSTTVSVKTNFDNDVSPLSAGFMKIQQNIVSVVTEMDEAKTNASTLISGIFNFNDNKAYVQQSKEDKDFMKQYNAKRGNMYCIGTEFYKDKIVVIKEARTVETSTNFGMGPGAMSESETIYTYSPLIVTIYSSTMQQTKEFQIAEFFKSFFPSFGSGYKILNNKLYLFYNYDKGKMNIHVRYQAVNLDNFSTETEQELNIDPKLNTILFGYGTVWFNNTGLFPFVQQGAFSPNKVNTHFKEIDF